MADSGTISKSSEMLSCTRNRGLVAVKAEQSCAGMPFKDCRGVSAHSDGAVHDNRSSAQACKRIKHGRDKDG